MTGTDQREDSELDRRGGGIGEGVEPVPGQEIRV
jgi:hypothetical protein